MMNCNDTKPLLDLLSDGVLDTKDCALVLNHLKSCEDCQREWNDLENLRTRFREAKEKAAIPSDFMERITETLKKEKKAEERMFFKKYTKAVPMFAVAATLALIGLLCVPSFHVVDNKSGTIHSAMAENLAADMISKDTVEPVLSRKELATRLGYNLKYLSLPSWKMTNAGIYKSKSRLAIARIDFIGKGAGSDMSLSCYQGLQGTIQANASKPEFIGQKRVFFGKQGQFQFALWSQDGRDYLFVTALPKYILEEIVRSA